MRTKKILLHRFVSVEKLIDLIENKHLVLIKPEKWLDPLENIISRVKFKKGSEILYIDYLKNVYGICLTKANESNLMWESYIPNGSGVRITFNKALLISEVLNSNLSTSNFVYDYVQYQRYDEIMAQLEDRKLLVQYFNKPSNALLKYLFIKRKAYRYEEEFRIIYDANKDEEEFNDVVSVSIEPQRVIDKISFHPKMADSDCRAIEKYLIRQGIAQSKIVRSLLYKKKITTIIKL